MGIDGCTELQAHQVCEGCGESAARAGTAEEAVPLQVLLDTDKPEEYLRPVDSMFRNYPAVTLSSNQEKRCRNGNSFSVQMEPGTYRAYSKAGELLMLAKVEDNIMSTIKSFFEV